MVHKMDLGSSPLAALRTSHPPGWGGQNQFQRPLSRKGSTSGTQQQSGGLFVSSKGAGFFPMTPRVESSSPTSSLTATISSNFFIEKTPAISTPRRTLFTSSNLDQSRNFATPAIPTSPSPLFGATPLPQPAFSASPLPQKSPLFPTLNDGISPTTPAPANQDEDVAMSLCWSLPIPKRDTKPLFSNRKKSASVGRPTLAHKNSFPSRQTSSIATPTLARKNSIPSRQPSSFFATPKKTIPSIFQNNNSTMPGTPDLEEMFNSSPASTVRKSGGFPNLDSPMPRLRLMNGHKNIEGSPIGMLNRKAVSRPKNKVRRTLSMYETVDQVIKKDDAPLASPVPSETTGESVMLPSFTNKDDTIRRIDKATMVQVLEGHYKEQYDQCYIVDCRFEYEYQGGHIDGAININSNEALEETFINNPKEGKTLIIFHCEYSAHRAPRMAHQLRQRDRQQNMHRYPELFYPEVYILEGGYSSFFKEHKAHCFPQKYVEMNDASHKQTCEKEMGRFRRNTKFARAQTFHYGSVANTNQVGSPVPFNRKAENNSSNIGHPYPRPLRDSGRRAASY